MTNEWRRKRIGFLVEKTISTHYLKIGLPFDGSLSVPAIHSFFLLLLLMTKREAKCKFEGMKSCLSSPIPNLYLQLL